MIKRRLKSFEKRIAIKKVNQYSPNWNLDDLKRLYLNRIKDNKAKSRQLQKEVKRIFYNKPISSLIYFLAANLYLIFYISIIDDFSSFNYGLLLLLLVPVSFYLYYLFQLKKKFNTHKEMVLKQIKSGVFKIVDINKIEYLDSIVSGLREKMNIEFPVTILRSNNKSYLPSIDKIQDMIYLILPMNFFLIAKKHPKRAESLIAHEFGHILQEDTENWKDLVFYNDYLNQSNNLNQQIFNSLYWISIVAYLITIPIFIMKVLFLIGALARNHKTKIKRNKLIDYRKTSEELADTAAIIFSDGYKLGECLQFYAKNGAVDSIHPRRQKRRSYIIKTMKKYNLIVDYSKPT